MTVRPTPALSPSNNNIAGERFLLSGTAEERAARFKTLLNIEDIVAVSKPSERLTEPQVAYSPDGEPADIVDVFSPEDGGKGETIRNIYDRIEGRDIDIICTWRTPFPLKRIEYLELKSISEYLSRHYTESFLQTKDKDGNEYTIQNSEERPVNREPGTVYFELYQQTQNGYSRGSLFHWYVPDKANEEGQIEVDNDRRATHVTPHYVLFLLFADVMDDQETALPMYPVAAISFRWEDLKERLYDLSDEKLIAENFADSITKAQAEKKRGRMFGCGDIVMADGTGMCWHVPFDHLKDIATVTIIGEPNKETLEAAKKRSTKKDQYGNSVTRYWNIDLMEKRLQYLIRAATDGTGNIRRIPYTYKAMTR